MSFQESAGKNQIIWVGFANLVQCNFFSGHNLYSCDLRISVKYIHYHNLMAKTNQASFSQALEKIWDNGICHSLGESVFSRK